MKSPQRRKFLQLAAGAASAAALSRPTWAQSWPTRPIRLIVPFPAGNSADLYARLIAQYLAERLGQAVVVDNRPGGSTNIGTEAVVRAPPDGYTLLYTSAASTINASLYEKLSFNFRRDLVPVAPVQSAPLVMVVSPSFPARSVAEFIAYAKANPGKLSYASGPTGTSLHMAGELLKMLTGISMVHIPYRGNNLAMIGIFANEVQAMFDIVPAALEHITAGKLRALAVTGPARLPVLPDIPAMAEFLSGYQAVTWTGIVAPKDTPPEIVRRLNTDINTGLRDAKVVSVLSESGGAVFAASPAEFGKFIADETDRWAKVIKFAGIMPE
jgi:tripartite-type tricarboxylate transporter receptor subunit TctC